MQRLRGELPFLLGCLAAASLLLRPGIAFFGPACGSDWPTYLDNAAVLWHPAWTELVYQDWRRPLHALLVGLLGEPLGYLRGAQLLTLLSSLGLVLGAGLLGRALAGRGAGVLATIAVSLLPSLEQSSRWINLYPLQAGLGALALGVGASCLRWPRRGLALGAGLLAGLCAAVDHRGLVVVAAVVPAVLLGVVGRGPGRGPRPGWIALALCLGLGCAWGLDQGLQARLGIHPRSLVDQLGVQAEVSIEARLPQELRQRCGEPGMDMPARLDCARALLPYNLTQLTGPRVLPPASWLALLIPLLLPAAGDRRLGLGALVLLGVPCAGLGLGMALVAYPERYALLQLVPLVVLVPVSLARVATLLGGGPRVRALCLGGAVLLLGLAWPGLPGLVRSPASHCRDNGIPVPGLEAAQASMSAWAARALGSDDLLLDCSYGAFAQRVLPARPPIRQALLDTPDCARWVQDPPAVAGALWLVSFRRPDGLPLQRGTSDRELLAAGWQPVGIQGGEDQAAHPLTLWRR